MLRMTAMTLDVLVFTDPLIISLQAICDISRISRMLKHGQFKKALNAKARLS